MQRWQYLTLIYNQTPNGVWVWADNGLATTPDQRFNEFGTQGWELAAVSDDIELNNMVTKQVAYHFKRPF